MSCKSAFKEAVLYYRQAAIIIYLCNIDAHNGDFIFHSKFRAYCDGCFNGASVNNVTLDLMFYIFKICNVF